MAHMDLFRTNTSTGSPFDASSGIEKGPLVSDFLTVQSFTNFAVMTGAISAAWHGSQKIFPWCQSMWVPYAFAFVWGLISVWISIEGLFESTGTGFFRKVGVVLKSVFLALINSLVLAGAVVGTNLVTK